MSFVGHSRLFLSLLFIALISSVGGAGASSSIYEGRTDFLPANRIDELVLSRFKELGIAPAHECSDAVFVRRAYLDVIGTLPTARETREFLDDTSDNKRADLIEALLLREEFAVYWALKWCDLLRVKAEFPINLWPNGVQVYHRWIHEAMRDNMPYDEFARNLLTSRGSNFRVPPVNFYRATQSKDPEALASVAVLTFMGSRIDSWPDRRRNGVEAFFRRVAFKGTAEWKEEIIYLDPAPTEPLKCSFPDGRKVIVPPGKDPRVVFADWLIHEDNPWFARNIVNRQWAWLFGRGIIHEPDDIRADNRPSHPQLLNYLEEELVRSDYDLQHTFRLILNSRTYQQSSIRQCDHEKAEIFFAHYPVRRLDAEVLIDALHALYGGEERYASLIPEPFTFIPEEHRTIDLADGSITSQFLETFGRPARDTGLETERNNTSTKTQRLHLLNSTHVLNMIKDSPQLKMLARKKKRNRIGLIVQLYMSILSRPPTEQELRDIEEYFSAPNRAAGEALTDLAWALTNTKEFLFRH